MRAWACILALLVVLAAAGCGGSDGDSSPTTATQTAATEAAATQTPAAQTGATSDHFTTAQWAKYQQAVASFRKLNISTLARVRLCAKPGTSEAPLLETCVGDSLDKLFDATATLAQTLNSFSGTVSGDCESALNGLLGYAVPYQASIKSLQATIDADNVATTYSSVSGLQTARSGGQKAAAAVSNACAP